MNKKQKLAIVILSLFVIGMCIGAADATHTVTKGKTKVKINNKEYKKLTSYKTEYKNVTKTRNVTKYKNVTKTRQVTKSNITTKENIKVNSTYLYTGDDLRALYKTDEVIGLEEEGYVRSGEVWTVNYTPEVYLKEAEWGYDDNRRALCHYKKSDDYQNFTKTTYYNVTEKYTAKEPYKVTEKYKTRVAFKVRKYATVTKTVPKKYKIIKKKIPVYKKVKVAKTIGKWKYLGKSAIFGIQSTKERKYTANKAKTLKANGWKINKKKHKSEFDFIEGSYKHYYYCTKKVYTYKKKVVKYKYKKIKKPIKMRMMSWAQNAAPKGKVWVTLYYGNQLKQGKCISNGYAKIK